MDQATYAKKELAGWMMKKAAAERQIAFWQQKIKVDTKMAERQFDPRHKLTKLLPDTRNLIENNMLHMLLDTANHRMVFNLIDEGMFTSAYCVKVLLADKATIQNKDTFESAFLDHLKGMGRRRLIDGGRYRARYFKYVTRRSKTKLLDYGLHQNKMFLWQVDEEDKEKAKVIATAKALKRASKRNKHK